MWKQAFYAFMPLAVLIAIPIFMRPAEKARSSGGNTTGDRVIIISPHSESIRYEFSRGFREYYRQQYGRDVSVEWRTPGGTSDIVRFIADRFEAAFKARWNEFPGHAAWDKVVAGNFTNPKAVAGSGLPEAAILARKEFIASDTGIGIDLFFGGGQFDHQRHADKGYAVDAGIQKKHPEWFSPEIIPQRFSGEVFFDPAGRYYGTCLAAFGICWNFQRGAELPEKTAPEQWSALGEPRFFQRIAIADPTKAGSVNKCFEMLIQQQIAMAIAKDPANGLPQGWANGVNLIKRIAANSRYVTDSAGKVPHDVASGAAAAGICIDFYGQTEAEWSAFQNHGVPRMAFISPSGGTSVSADPIQLLRGAPNRKAATAFIEFVLSTEGQKLWNFRVGTPGGPRQYALRRLPIRKDLYQEKYRQYMSDPEVNLYQSCSGFIYHPEWTGRYFGLLRTMIKNIALNPQMELQEAWREIIKADGPSAVPRAMAAFERLPFDYRMAEQARLQLQPDKNPIREILRVQREWSENARRNYLEAARLAREGK